MREPPLTTSNTKSVWDGNDEARVIPTRRAQPPRLTHALAVPLPRLEGHVAESEERASDSECLPSHSNGISG